jgi:transposase
MWRKLTDEQWAKVEPNLSKPRVSNKGGRPPADNRKCFEGILWILWTGAPWSELPPRYGSSSAVWRRLNKWCNDGTLLKLWRAFLSELNDRDRIRWDECFADGTFVPAKKGGLKSAKPRGEKERSLWFWSMARVLRSEFTWTRRPLAK